MKEITVPHYKDLRLKHIVLDYNGTLAKDGEMKIEVRPLLASLREHYEIHVITADTFGSVKAQLEGSDVTIKVLQSSDHTLEKAAYVDELDASVCATVGNGNNDTKMLEKSALGIALIGDEGCSTKTLMSCDIVCKEIADALELFLDEKRLIATLRK